MRIGMILEQRFPPDIRVEKEARSLINAGHEVFILSKPKRNAPVIEKGEFGIIIRRKISLFNRLRGFLANYFLNFHPFWYKEILWLIRNYSIEIIHVHDLPLVKTAVIAANDNIPVIADLHESWPPALQVWAQSSYVKNNFIFKSILYNKKRWENFEKEAVSLSTKIITVVEESKDRIEKLYQVPQEKIIVVSNTESKQSIFLNANKNKLAKWEYLKNKFTLVYVGGFGAHRGLDTVLRAISLLKSEIPELVFMIAGKGPAYTTKQLQMLIKVNQLNDMVIMPGYIPFEQVPYLVYVSKAGIIPHNLNEHTDHTIPHKLSQFMLAKRPVIVSSCRPLKRIVNNTQAGFVFEADNPYSLAEKILELYNNPMLGKRLGENGQQSVIKGENNWETDAQRLISLYMSLNK